MNREETTAERLAQRFMEIDSSLHSNPNVPSMLDFTDSNPQYKKLVAICAELLEQFQWVEDIMNYKGSTKKEIR